MRIGPIVLKIRAYFVSVEEHRIGNRVAGAAELAAAYKGTLNSEAAFVIQLAESCPVNPMDSGINQELTERFAIIVALNNDTSDADKLGLTAYDRLEGIRTDLFKAILGWQMPEMNSLVYYRGGRLLSVTPAWMWYQFEFEAYRKLSDNDGVVMAELPFFDSIYSDYILSPDAQLPSEYPAKIPDMQQFIDLTEDPGAGAFGIGFSTGFDWYDED